jgi:UDP-N-acetyl-D-galactosamine dehydrogenase
MVYKQLLPSSKQFEQSGQFKIAVIGLGYVGLPLAIEFSKKYDVLGYDNNLLRINELNYGKDVTKQINMDDFKHMLKSPNNDSPKLQISADEKLLINYNTFVITVHTPINKFKSPDLGPLLKATAMIGAVLKHGDLVIYESTVYPGCTEEDCVPVLEKESGLKLNRDFFVGYSPERINPGDKINTLTTIKKVTSGSTPEVADMVDYLYASVIPVGTYKAPSIKVAEAAKVIENAQRDINISFINELALIFDHMNIDTNDVLDAAGTKWNFLKYRPGLVGGHCISVDPYYLAHKAESLGYHPQVILSGRRVNDNMGIFVANKLVKLLIKRKHKIAGLKTLILGITFKENCPDIRNTKVIDIYHELDQFGIHVDIYDPWANPEEVKEAFDIDLVESLKSTYNAIVLAVAHEQFALIDIKALSKDSTTVIFDTKAFLPRHMVDCRL